MDFQAIKKRETGFVELRMSQSAVIFMGGMARGIANVILSELIPSLLPETKNAYNVVL
jgi:hypothetical protein